VEVAVGDGVVGALGIEVDLEDVPAARAVEELKGLDSAAHGFGVGGVGAGFVAGVDVGHDAEAVDLVGEVVVQEAVGGGAGVG